VRRWLEALGFDVYIREPAKSGNVVSETSLGAWVVKCDPAVWDLAGFLADGKRVRGPATSITTRLPPVVHLLQPAQHHLHHRDRRRPERHLTPGRSGQP
jgi:hypothetical protein